MIERVCPVCGALFSIWPNKVRPVNCCSARCLAVRRSNAEDDLAAFDPGPPADDTDRWIDRWRARRVQQEAAS